MNKNNHFCNKMIGRVNFKIASRYFDRNKSNKFTSLFKSRPVRHVTTAWEGGEVVTRECVWRTACERSVVHTRSVQVLRVVSAGTVA